MESNGKDNISSLTLEEILEQFPRVFNNEFETRKALGNPINIWINRTWNTFLTSGYTKGYYSLLEMVNSKGEKETAHFWRQNYSQYCYSFKNS